MSDTNIDANIIGMNHTLSTYMNFYDVIKIDQTGFYYKDEFIEDAGKAYELLVKVLEGKCNCD